MSKHRDRRALLHSTLDDLPRRNESSEEYSDFSDEELPYSDPESFPVETFSVGSEQDESEESEDSERTITRSESLPLLSEFSFARHRFAGRVDPSTKHMIRQRFLKPRTTFNVKRQRTGWRLQYYKRNTLYDQLKDLNVRPAWWMFCSPGSSSFRWWILFFTCFMSFGPYVFYYNVSALSTSLKEVFDIFGSLLTILKGMDIDSSQLGLLFSVVNIPNIFIVLFAGMIHLSNPNLTT